MLRIVQTTLVAAMFGPLACGGKSGQLFPPPQQDEGGSDVGSPASDAPPGEPGDAAGTSDASSDALTAPGVDSGADSDADAETDSGLVVLSDAGEGGLDAAPIPVSCAEATTCPTAIPLSSIYGGINGGPNSMRSILGDHSDWYVIEVVPNPSATTLGVIALGVYLRPPADVDFGIVVYVTSAAGLPQECSTVYGTADNGAGKPDAVHLSWPNNDGTPATRLISIHVVAKSGSQCTSAEKFELYVIAG